MKKLSSIPALSKLVGASLIALTLTACKHGDLGGAHVAGWTLVDASQRHPIIVSQKPAVMSVRVARGSMGLTHQQRGRLSDFLARYRSGDAGSSRIVISVPSGAPNEVAAVAAVDEIRHMMHRFGFSDGSIAVEAYHTEREHQPPIRVSYMSYVAEAPKCGEWPTNLAEEPRNLAYPNFGCAQQNNLAAMIANPADLLGPRGMDERSNERRQEVYDKYREGKPTGSQKSEDEKVRVKQN